MSDINEKIEELTLDILKRNDLLKIPADISVIAKSNNIDVFISKFDERILGAIRYNKEKDKFQIVLNSTLNLQQRRFTLAHELGHYFLHEDILKSTDIHVDILYKTTDDKEIEKGQEKEAEYFAGALLMNRILLEKTYEKVTDIKELSELFEVSESDMTLRLSLLGIIWITKKVLQNLQMTKF